MNIRVGHLYPDYLNIYADRGNIAVLSRRAEWRGHELEVTGIGMGDNVYLGDRNGVPHLCGGAEIATRGFLAPTRNGCICLSLLTPSITMKR